MPQVQGFPENKVAAAKKLLLSYKPWWSRYLNAMPIIPIEVPADDIGKFSATTSTDRERILYIDVNFAVNAPIELLAGSIERELQRQARDVWGRFPWVTPSERDELVNIAIEMEIATAIDEERATLSPEKRRTHIYSNDMARKWGGAGIPSLGEMAWAPERVGLEPGKSAEFYYQELKRLMPPPPPPSADEDEDDQKAGQPDEDEQQEQSPQGEGEQGENSDDDNGEQGDEGSSGNEERGDSDSDDSGSDPDDDESDMDDTDGDSRRSQNEGPRDDSTDSDSGDEQPDDGAGDESDDPSDGQEDSQGDPGDEPAEGAGEGEGEGESDPEQSEDSQECEGKEGDSEPSDDSQGDEAQESDDSQAQNGPSDDRDGPSDESSDSEDTSSDAGDESASDEQQSDQPDMHDGEGDSTEREGEGNESDSGNNDSDDQDGQQFDPDQSYGDRARDLMKESAVLEWQASDLQMPDEMYRKPDWKPAEEEIPIVPVDYKNRMDDVLAEDVHMMMASSSERETIGSYMKEWAEEEWKRRPDNWEKLFAQSVSSAYNSTRMQGASDLSYSVRNPNQPKIGPVLMGLHDYSPSFVVILDVSGSMRSNNSSIASIRAFDELSRKVLGKYGQQVTYITYDSQVRHMGRVAKVNESLKETFRFGGGGTTIQDVMVQLEQGEFKYEGKRVQRPDIMVVLTDCMFKWPWMDLTRAPRAMRLIVCSTRKRDQIRMTGKPVLPPWLRDGKDFIYINK